MNRDEKLVALQLRHYVDEDAFCVSLVVGADAEMERLPSLGHILTAVSLRIDHLFARDGTTGAEPRDIGHRALAVCDPGGFLNSPGRQILELLIEKFINEGGVIPLPP